MATQSVSLRRTTNHALTYGVLTIVGLVLAFPFLYMVLASLKTSSEVVTVPPRLFPSTWQWSNYREVLSIPSLLLGRELLNSVIVTFCVVVGQVLTSILAGYAFARLVFPARDFLFVAYLGTLMVPFAVLLVPLYRIMFALGWVDSLLALIVPWIFTAYGTFLLRQSFMGIPKELEEAALIDGANRWGILFRICVPLAVPAIATLSTFSFLYAWNSFLWPLIIITNPKNKVITQGIMELQSLYSVRIELIMAGSVLAILPTMLIYLFAQRYFIEGVATSGMGGR